MAIDLKRRDFIMSRRRCERPGRHCAAETCDEVAPLEVDRHLQVLRRAGVSEASPPPGLQLYHGSSAPCVKKRTWTGYGLCRVLWLSVDLDAELPDDFPVLLVIFVDQV